MRYCLLCMVFLTIASLPLHAAESYKADVCIYGGTSAGVIAAVQVSRMGKTVILIEPGQHLGGMSVEGLGGTDIDNHSGFQNSPAVGGLALEFYARISDHYQRRPAFDEMIATHQKKRNLWVFEPHVAENVFDEWVEEAKVSVLKGARLAEKNGVQKDGTQIVELKLENGDVITAPVFIDATYEGDLLAAAGVTTVVGREGNQKYRETKNGIVIPTTKDQFPFRLDPYLVPGDPSSGLIFCVQNQAPGLNGEASDAIQAFCFRLCLTKEPANRIAFTKPDNYDDAQYEIYRRYIKAGGKLWKPGASLPHGKTDLGSWHDLSGNLIGWNHNWNKAGYGERAGMLSNSLHFIQGLCWFLANDPAVPDNLRKEWNQWGVCQDEFVDNAGWPRMFYVRNGRRLVSDVVLTEHHLQKVSPVPITDPVSMVYWPPDFHHARRIVKDGAIWNEGAVFGGDDWIPFGVSYQATVPKRTECTNLLTPTCPSTSYVAYGAYRIEFTFMTTAQSTAVAAVLALEQHLPVQDVGYSELKALLLQQGQVLELSGK
jgi:hypothetical protein